MSRSEVYKPCPTGADKQPTIGIEGPGVGLGYHAWYLFPENTFSVQEDAEKAARLMNLAFEEGQKAKAAEIRMALLCTG